jgi:hypothetical protein
VTIASLKPKPVGEETNDQIRTEPGEENIATAMKQHFVVRTWEASDRNSHLCEDSPAFRTQTTTQQRSLELMAV